MRAFIDTLKDIRDGQLVAELPEKVQALVEAVQATGKKGKLQLNLELAVAKGGMLILSDDVKLTLPEPEKDNTTVFFATEDRDLSRRDPKQPRLPDLGPRVVPMTAEGTAQGNG